MTYMVQKLTSFFWRCRASSFSFDLFHLLSTCLSRTRTWTRIVAATGSLRRRTRRLWTGAAFFLNQLKQKYSNRVLIIYILFDSYTNKLYCRVLTLTFLSFFLALLSIFICNSSSLCNSCLFRSRSSGSASSSSFGSHWSHSSCWMRLCPSLTCLRWVLAALCFDGLINVCVLEYLQPFPYGQDPLCAQWWQYSLGTVVALVPSLSKTDGLVFVGTPLDFELRFTVIFRLILDIFTDSLQCKYVRVLRSTCS